MLAIKAKKRDVAQNVSALRKAGEMPAVFYGAGEPSTPVTVSKIDFKKVWRDAGESSAVKVTLPEKTIDVLIHEVQTDPVTDEPIHADFLAIDMNKSIKVKVPLEFAGVSEAVKTGIGNLVKVLHEVEVEALPKDLPHNLVADISPLTGLDTNITVADIKLPLGVTMVTPGTDVVASIVAQVEEKEEVAPVDLSAIEMSVEKGKKDLPAQAGEEGGEGAEIAAPTAPEEKKEKPRP